MCPTLPYWRFVPQTRINGQDRSPVCGVGAPARDANCEQMTGATEVIPGDLIRPLLPVCRPPGTCPDQSIQACFSFLIRSDLPESDFRPGISSVLPKGT